MNLLQQKTRLLVLLTLLLGVGFTLVNGLGYVSTRSMIRSNIVTQNLPAAGDNVYSEISRQLLRPVYISKQMAQDTFLHQWIEGDEADMAQVVNYLSNIKREFSTNTSFFISERSKKYYYADGLLKTLSTKNPRDAWYFRASRMKEDYELSTDADDANNELMTVFINHKVFGKNNRYLGIVGVGVTFDSITQLAKTIEQRFGQRVYFVDSQGQVALSDSFRVTPELALVLKRAVLKQEVQQFSYTTGGDNYLVQSRYVPEIKWFLVVEQNESQANQSLLRQVGLNALLGLLVTALILGLALYAINQHQKKMEELATTDPLTKAKTRLVGNALLEAAAAKPKVFSVALFDLDHFKSINDTYGHNAGDSVLQHTVQRIEGLKLGTLVRWGGEEFVLMMECELTEAMRRAEAVRQALASHVVATAQGNIAATLSVGVGSYQQGESVVQLLSRVDQALYQAKHQGRNKVVASQV